MTDKILNLNLDQAAPPALIHVTQGDTAWRWHFPVFLDGSRWSIPSGARAIFKGLKPDGHVFAYTASVSSNEILVDAQLQMTVCAGPVGCTLVILDSAGKLLHTAKITLLVAADPEGSFDVASVSALPAYAELLSQYGDIVPAAAQTRAAAADALASKNAAASSATAAASSAASAGNAKTAAEKAQTAAEAAAGSVSSSAAQIAANKQDIGDLKSALNATNATLTNPIYIEDYDKIKGIYPLYIPDAGWHNSEFFSLESGVTYQFCIFLTKPLSSASYFRLLNNNTALVSKQATVGTTSIIFEYTPSSNIDNARFNMSVNMEDYPVTVMCYYGLNGITQYITPLSNSLLPAYEDFAAIGDANALKINRTYLVTNRDVVDGSNLPATLATELPAWPAVITSFASSQVRGAQIIISSNNVFFRVITYSGQTVNGGSIWRQLSDERTYLKPAFAEFSTIGDADGLALNQTYLVYGHDVVSGSNLPEGLSAEIDFWPAHIYTMQSTESKGFQVVVSSSNIFFRTVSILNGSIDRKPYGGSTWRQLSDGRDYLKPAFAEFSTIGNANGLALNQTYLVYGHDVVSGANLPEGLSAEIDFWPAHIYTMQSTESKGFQVVVSSSNIFFRTVSILNGSIDSGPYGGSIWRQLNNDQKAQQETSKAIEDAIENAVQTFETSDLYSSVNGAYLAKAIETDAIDCTPATIYGVHESNIYIYNGNIYILCGANKIDATEDQTKYNIELVKTAIDGTPILNRAVCSVGDTILNNQIVRCQASFILPVNDKIHIYVDVGIASGYKIYHTVYDISTNTFSSFDEVYYVNSAGNTVKAETSEEQYICNHWFSYNGNDYCTAVYFGRTECGIAYTDDFTTFRFIAKVNVDVNIVGGEMTAEYIGIYDKLVVAYRTASNKRNCVFQQYDCATGVWEKKNYIPDATARPMFFKLDNELYLANNAPYTRYDMSIWHYITAHNWNHMGTLEPVAVARLGIPCTYFSFCVYNNNLYMVGICNSLTKVKVAVIEPETKSKAHINNTLLALFS